MEEAVQGYGLETDRLRMRPFAISDLYAVYAIYSRPDVARYLYEEALTEDEASVAFEKKISMDAIRSEGDGLRLAVLLKATDELIGDLSLFRQEGGNLQGEIGFVFHPDHQGHGYATEARLVVLRLAFEDLKLHRVIGRTEARNTAAASVMEKLGMRREAHLIENEWVKEEWQSELVYAILDSEWRADAD